VCETLFHARDQHSSKRVRQWSWQNCSKGSKNPQNVSCSAWQRLIPSLIFGCSQVGVISHRPPWWQLWLGSRQNILVLSMFEFSTSRLTQFKLSRTPMFTIVDASTLQAKASIFYRHVVSLIYLSHGLHIGCSHICGWQASHQRCLGRPRSHWSSVHRVHAYQQQ